MSTIRNRLSSKLIMHHWFALTLAVCFFLLFAVPESLRGEGPRAAQSENAGQLQYSVAIDGDYAVVGAQWHDGYRGAAYVLQRRGDSWIVQQKLQPDDLGRYDHFGGSVSISGDYIVIGAAWHDTFRGAAYVFKYSGDTWIQQQKLVASDAVPDGQFAQRVSVDKDVITIAAVPGEPRAVPRRRRLSALSTIGRGFRQSAITRRWKKPTTTSTPWAT